MSVGAAVAFWSGIAARSLTLVAFGFDSVIELASAGVLIWRLTVEIQAPRLPVVTIISAFSGKSVALPRASTAIVSNRDMQPSFSRMDRRKIFGVQVGPGPVLG